MAGDTLVMQEHLDRAVRRALVHLSPGVLARCRVAVAIDLDVVVDAGPRHLMFGVLVVLLRQCSKGRLVQLDEGTGAVRHRIRRLL